MRACTYEPGDGIGYLTNHRSLALRITSIPVMVKTRTAKHRTSNLRKKKTMHPKIVHESVITHCRAWNVEAVYLMKAPENRSKDMECAVFSALVLIWPFRQATPARFSLLRYPCSLARSFRMRIFRAFPPWKTLKRSFAPLYWSELASARIPVLASETGAVASALLFRRTLCNDTGNGQTRDRARVYLSSGEIDWSQPHPVGYPAGLRPDPDATAKLRAAYRTILERVQTLAPESAYRRNIELLTRYRLEVTEAHLDDRKALEDKIGAGLVEELLATAYDELDLIECMAQWKPWEGQESRSIPLHVID